MRNKDFEGTGGEINSYGKGQSHPSRSSMRYALNKLLKEHGRTRENGNVASHSTTTTKGETLHTCMNDLWGMGYKIGNPANLNERHITALCKHWLLRSA